jgi:hypothetical protein
MEDGRLFDEVVNRALREPDPGSDVVPAIVRVLMRRYATTGRPDLEEAIGPALARALDASESGVSPAARADLILLFVEGAALSSDERLRQAVSLLVSKAIEDWPAVGDVASAARSIDSCLRAADLISSDDANRLVAIAVDELERIVSPCYRPGEGMAHSIDDPRGTRGILTDQATTAAALLTAYEVTGRLPYAMLAEELMQYATRLQPALNMESEPLERERFIGSCESVRVLCRVAALHRNADYQRAAVIAPATDYAVDAERLLRRLAASQHEQDAAAAAEFGIALSDWLAIR